MTKTIIKFITLIASVLSTGYVFAAAQEQAPTNNTVPNVSATAYDGYAPIEPLPETKAKIMGLIGDFVKQVEFFEGPYGLLAMNIKTASGQTVAAFTNTNGDYMMAGSLVDTKDSTQHHVNVANLVDPEPEKTAGQLAGELDGLPYAEFGEGDNVINVMVDVNCPYCHETYDDLLSLIDQNPGVYKAKFYTVGYLNADSQQKATRLSEIVSTQRTEAFGALMADRWHNLGRYEYQENDGAVQIYDFMKRNEFSAVPVVISEVKGAARVVRGKPDRAFYAAVKKALN